MLHTSRRIMPFGRIMFHVSSSTVEFTCRGSSNVRPNERSFELAHTTRSEVLCALVYPSCMSRGASVGLSATCPRRWPLSLRATRGADGTIYRLFNILLLYYVMVYYSMNYCIMK